MRTVNIECLSGTGRSAPGCGKQTHGTAIVARAASETTVVAIVGTRRTGILNPLSTYGRHYNGLDVHGAPG